MKHQRTKTALFIYCTKLLNILKHMRLYVDSDNALNVSDDGCEEVQHSR